MSQLVRCKACGYIMRERRVRKVCPACGLPKKVFEPYAERISPTMSLILNLDLHPILVHFPQAFASILPFLAVATIWFRTVYCDELTVVLCFTAIALPVTTLGAFVSGLVDAKTKLKRLTTPALIKKMTAGAALFLFSAGNALIIVRAGYVPGTRVYVLLLSIASLVCAVLLGMMGKKLIPVIMAGGAKSA